MNENQYQPWVQLGFTEAAYWKMCYLESQQEVARLENGIRDWHYREGMERKVDRSIDHNELLRLIGEDI